jgi:uncharacterized protein YecT (DUF1311 family)
MANKDIVGRIEEIRSRGANISIHESQISELSHWLSLQKSGDRISLSFVPIRLFTIIEVTLRDLLRQLIDRGGKFLENARTLWGKEKLDFDILLGLQGKRVSLGELISHSISLNSIEQILAAFETLDPSFKNNISTAKNRWKIEIHEAPDVPIIANIDRTISDLKSLIEKRHILTHEIPNTEIASEIENETFISSTLDFLSAIEWHYSGDQPLTQLAMNMTAYENYQSAKREMEQFYSELSESNKLNAELLDISQKLFLDLAEANANLEAEQVSGGSMYPMLHSLGLESSYRERIKYLKNWLSKEEGDL